MKDVTFASDEPGVTLAGTLVWPSGDGPFPAVALVSGSGAQNRDEEIFGHRPFHVLADALVRADIAVLRYDDRGVGESTGNFDLATSADFARDARGAVRYLATQDAFAVRELGLIGHSEGGLVAPMVADETSDVQFLVLLAAPAVNGGETLVSQARVAAAAEGATGESLQAAVATQQALVDCFGSGDTAGIERCLRDVLRPLGTPESAIQANVAQLNTPWMRFFIAYDPAPVLRRLSIPVLALFGSLDVQVQPELHRPAMERALSDNEHATIQKLEGLNHLFQHATTGLPNEYARIDETFAPEALEAIASWIHAVTESSP